MWSEKLKYWFSITWLGFLAWYVMTWQVTPFIALFGYGWWVITGQKLSAKIKEIS